MIKVSLGPRKKLELLTFYNKTKSGADTMDQMLQKYTSQRQMMNSHLLLIHIQDRYALAAYIIYKTNVDMHRHKKNNHNSFLSQLRENLCFPSIHHRSKNIEAMLHFLTMPGVESILNSSNHVFCLRYSPIQVQPQIFKHVT